MKFKWNLNFSSWSPTKFIQWKNELASTNISGGLVHIFVVKPWKALYLNPKILPKFAPMVSTLSNWMELHLPLLETETWERKRISKLNFSWMYRIRPSVSHLPYHPIEQGLLDTDFSKCTPNPNQLRWKPFDIPPPEKPTDFVQVMTKLCLLKS